MTRARISMGLAWLLLPVMGFADGHLAYGPPGGQPQQMMEFAEGAVRMSQQGEAQWMLYRDEEKTLYIIDDAQRSYHKVTRQMAQDMAERVSAMQAQIEQQMAMLPPQQREMMKSMMPKLPDMAQQHSYRVEKDGAPRQSGAYNCQPFTVYDNDQASELLCLAAVKDVGVAKADFELLKRMGETMSSLAAQFGAGSMAAVLDKIDGLPVEHRKPGDSAPQAVLLSSGNKAPEAARMSLPEGYSEKPLMPGMMP